MARLGYWCVHGAQLPAKHSTSAQLHQCIRVGWAEEGEAVRHTHCYVATDRRQPRFSQRQDEANGHQGDT